MAILRKRGGVSKRREADNIAKEIQESGYKYTVDPMSGTYTLVNDAGEEYKGPLGGVDVDSNLLSKNRRLNRMIGEQLSHRSYLGAPVSSNSSGGDSNTGDTNKDADETTAQIKARENSASLSEKDKATQKIQQANRPSGLLPGIDPINTNLQLNTVPSRGMMGITNPNTNPQNDLTRLTKSLNSEAPMANVAEVSDPYMMVPNEEASKTHFSTWIPNWLGSSDYKQKNSFLGVNSAQEARTGRDPKGGDLLIPYEDQVADPDYAATHNVVRNPNYQEGLMPFDNAYRDYYVARGYNVQPITTQDENGTNYYYQIQDNGIRFSDVGQALDPRGGATKLGKLPQVVDYIPKLSKALGSGTRMLPKGQKAIAAGQKAIPAAQKAIGGGQKAIAQGQKAISQGQVALGQGQKAIGQGIPKMGDIVNKGKQAFEFTNLPNASGSVKALGQGIPKFNTTAQNATKAGNKRVVDLFNSVMDL